ncbi:hypothetical protein AGLY_001296 [Aphis glycines]|uniref:THAP-type domain-containing protein n=1 Tax=Aphis glycines TaxID=307491 RepID=A0A6G0U9W8_APHGL|nr:hypothetical protein AGLY_001296 [Aphis glycines]
MAWYGVVRVDSELLQQEYVRDISHGLKCNSHTRDVNNISLPFTLDSMLIHSLRIIGFFGKIALMLTRARRPPVLRSFYTLRWTYLPYPPTISYPVLCILVRDIVRLIGEVPLLVTKMSRDTSAPGGRISSGVTLNASKCRQGYDTLYHCVLNKWVTLSAAGTVIFVAFVKIYIIMGRCCVINCSSNTQKNKKCSLFTLPKNPIICKEWINILSEPTFDIKQDPLRKKKFL